MAKRISFLRILRATLTAAFLRWCIELEAPIRSLRLNVRKIDVFYDAKPSFIYGDKNIGKALLKGHFQNSEHNLDVGAQGDPWTLAVPSEQFARWLHSFYWLNDLAATKDKNANVRARNLVDKWIETYGKWNFFAWSPDILSERVFNLLTVWSPLLDGDSLSKKAQIRRISVVRQLKRLRTVYKHTSPGLHRLKAAAALAIGGAKIKEKTDAFLGRGLDWLDDEVNNQVLPDGGHISRSPEQALQALEILLIVDSLLFKRGVEGSRIVSRAIDRLRSVIPFFCAADGTLPNFNGGGENHPPRLRAIMKAAPDILTKPFGYCPHTGYQRISSSGTLLIMDTGGTPPGPFDTQAHLAPGSFELSTKIGRLVVNCGWSRQQPRKFKKSVRNTAAHSTLVLNNESAGRIVKDGWLAKTLGDVVTFGVGPVTVSRKEQDSGTWVEVSHGGYRKKIGLLHKRRVYMSIEGDDVRGEDTLLVPLGAVPLSNNEKPYDIRFHFHPDVRVSLSQDQKSALLIQAGKTGWRFRTDHGPIEIESSLYLGTGSTPRKCQQIVISGNAFCDSDGETLSNKVRWSFRKLEARN